MLGAATAGCSTSPWGRPFSSKRTLTSWKRDRHLDIDDIGETEPDTTRTEPDIRKMEPDKGKTDRAPQIWNLTRTNRSLISAKWSLTRKSWDLTVMNGNPIP